MKLGRKDDLMLRQQQQQQQQQPNPSKYLPFSGSFWRETGRETDREMFGFGFGFVGLNRPKPTDFFGKNRKTDRATFFSVHNE